MRETDKVRTLTRSLSGIFCDITLRKHPMVSCTIVLANSSYSLKTERSCNGTVIEALVVCSLFGNLSVVFVLLFSAWCNVESICEFKTLYVIYRPCAIVNLLCLPFKQHSLSLLKSVIIYCLTSDSSIFITLLNNLLKACQFFCINLCCWYFQNCRS